MSFAPGENVGPYRIIEQLGQGGMASVFKAYHPALDRFVAIKVLHPAFKEEPNFLTRFQREARVVAKLEHPNIVPVYDFAEHDGQPYLVMKYIDGITLKARLGHGPLSKQDALKIVDAVGKALTYAHERGVLHRDVKPSNVLLSPDGSIYLADFGLARMAEAGASTLSKDVMLGTPQYISPEQAKGNIELTECTDVYSFGVVLYELVVGRVPFNADTPFSIIHDHIYTPLPLPSKVNPRVPEVIERVLLKCLAKDPEDRFASIDSMVGAFRMAVEQGELSADIETIVAEPGVERQNASELAPGTTVDSGVGAPLDTGSTVKRRWPWVVGGLGLSFVCLFVFLLAINAADPGDVVDATEPVEEVVGQPLEPDQQGEDARPLETLTDPGAAYGRAEQLAGGGRNILAAQAFIRAGDLFLRDSLFIDAADSYLRALELDRLLFENQKEVVNRLVQAAFLGANSDEIWPILKRIELEADGWQLRPIFEARANLFVGDPAGTIPLLEEALRLEVESPLAMTVWAEYELNQGDPAEAERILDELLSQPDTLPPWLAEHCRNLMRAAQQG